MCNSPELHRALAQPRGPCTPLLEPVLLFLRHPARRCRSASCCVCGPRTRTGRARASSCHTQQSATLTLRCAPHRLAAKCCQTEIWPARCPPHLNLLTCPPCCSSCARPAVCCRLLAGPETQDAPRCSPPLLSHPPCLSCPHSQAPVVPSAERETLLFFRGGCGSTDPAVRPYFAAGKMLRWALVRALNAAPQPDINVSEGGLGLGLRLRRAGMGLAPGGGVERALPLGWRGWRVCCPTQRATLPAGWLDGGWAGLAGLT